jgi:penicillin-binding protein 1A
MDAAHKGKPRSEFARPPGVTTVAIDPKTGKLKAEGSEGEPMDEVFLAGTEPTDTADATSDAGAPLPGSPPTTLPSEGVPSDGGT